METGYGKLPALFARGSSRRSDSHETAFSRYCARKVAEWGDRFDDAELYPAFVPYFNSGERVRVRFSHGEERTGTIGATAGWRPAFLLVLTSRSLGSPFVLTAGDEVVAVKRGRKYVKVR